MKTLFRRVITLFLTALFCSVSFAGFAHAQVRQILPVSDEPSTCLTYDFVESIVGPSQLQPVRGQTNTASAKQGQLLYFNSDNCLEFTSCSEINLAYKLLGSRLDGRYLATKIRCGAMHFGDVPHYITRVLEFLIWIAGSIAVIMIMIGGYQYAVGALTENKGEGKKTLTNAIIGFMVVLLAWVIVNIAQAMLTTTLRSTASSTSTAQPAQQSYHELQMNA